ncbi:unnamed protein product [Camellia sinensis]
MVVELLKTKQVKAIIGPLTSMQENFLIHLGEEAHVPIISFSATSSSLSYLRSPYFFRAALNDSSQVQPITTIIQASGWKEIVPIYTENKYGEGLIPFLIDTFQENEIRVLYKSIIHPTASDEEIVAELCKLMTMQTRVFVVHMTCSLSARLFTKANEIGMMSEGYVWIITGGITNSLNFFDPSIIIDSMQGVIGVQPHVPKSKKLEDFISRWKNKKHQEKTSSDLNVFRLWAYEAAIALAMAVEKVGPLNLSISNIAKNSTTDFESVGVSQNGIHLCQALSSTRFRGLTGNFSFVDGQLQFSAFEIVNVIRHRPRGIGFWTPKHGIRDTTYTPKGWVVPTNGKVLRVAVPVKNFYTDFVRVRRDPITNRTMVTGYCIDIFDAVMAALPYSVPYEYIPFEKPYGVQGGFTSCCTNFSLGKFDAVVGDVAIRKNRSNYVDFTFPYTKSGVTMIVPFKDKKNYKSAWVFLKPLTWDLWVTSTCFFVFIAFVIWILEHQINEDFNGTPLRQVSTSVWFSFSTIFSHIAAFDEIRYLKLFTGRHCSKYTMVAPIHKTGGFGFAFRKGSHLVRDVSTAILHVIEEDKMLEIDKKWLQNNSCLDSTSTVSSNSLGVHSFWGLFLIVGVAASFALIISMAVLAYEHRSFLVHLDLKYLWRKYILKHEDTVTAIDTH